jgi:hypothetical protein
MSDKPKRPWFRFHLLTLVLFIVGVHILILVDLTKYRTSVKNVNFLPAYECDLVVEVNAYGRPFPAIYQTTGKAWWPEHHVPFERPLNVVWETSYIGIAFDAFFAIAFFFSIIGLSEHLLRRAHPPPRGPQDMSDNEPPERERGGISTEGEQKDPSFSWILALLIIVAPILLMGLILLVISWKVGSAGFH